MKKKIFLSLAAILALASLSGCNTTSGNENPYYDSESDSEVVHDVDRETAQVVIDMIEALDEDSTKEEILATLDAYNQLTKRQQSFVHNYEKLLEQIEKIEILELIDELNALIDSLNESDPDAEKVEEATTLYNELLSYGENWADKVSEERVNKLKACEHKVLEKVANPLLSKAASLDVTKTRDGVQFKLLTQRIDTFLSNYTEEQLSKLDLYDDYLKSKEYVDSGYDITTSEYISSTHNLPSSKLFMPIDGYYDDEYGYIYEEDLSSCTLSGPQNVQMAAKANWSNYKKIALFVSWPFSGSEIQFIQEKGVNAYTVATSQTTTKDQFLYFEIPVANLKDVEGEAYSHVGGYFADRSIANVAGYKVTAIVGIGLNKIEAQAAVDAVDTMIEALDLNNLTKEEVAACRKAYDELATLYSVEWQQKVKPENVAKLIEAEGLLSTVIIEEHIATANAVDVTTNKGLTQFALLSNSIDEDVAALDPSINPSNIKGYTDYLNKKAAHGSKTNILFDGRYYGDDKNSFKDYKKEEDSKFGYIYKTEFNSKATVNFSLYLGASGQNWSGLNKIGLFLELTEKTNDAIWFIFKNDWSVTSYIKGEVVNEVVENGKSVSVTYYLEYNLAGVKNLSKFLTDPYLSVYLTGSSYFANITSSVSF